MVFPFSCEKGKTAAELIQYTVYGMATAGTKQAFYGVSN